MQFQRAVKLPGVPVGFPQSKRRDWTWRDTVAVLELTDGCREILQKYVTCREVVLGHSRIAVEIHRLGKIGRRFLYVGPIEVDSS